jgi:hypothetical protein
MGITTSMASLCSRARRDLLRSGELTVKGPLAAHSGVATVGADGRRRAPSVPFPARPGRDLP